MKRILWFRRDLRIEDNPLLSFEGEVLPLFIFDSNILKPLHGEDKRVSFIFAQVIKLKYDLQEKGLDLKIAYGDPIEIFNSLNLDDFDEVVASGDYDAYAKERDRKISQLIHFRYLNDTYLFKPNEVLKDDGTPYLVFTPFYKKAMPILEEKSLEIFSFAKHSLVEFDYEGITHIEELGFKHVPLEHESPHVTLKNFIKKLAHYKADRDFLEIDASSSLSLDLRFGTISIREILRAVKGVNGSDDFIRQLIFRDFYAYLLFHFPTIETKNYKYRFNGIEDKSKFEAFCSAKTGVPIIDAGVRELVQTGIMHNRVRMICASFFTKDLHLPWQWGEAFFAQHLLDFDKASNVLSWQWSAGTGVDPQPYFRIFNPYLQSKKFDKDATYIKHWMNELKSIDAKVLHSEEALFATDIKGYPKPIVHHKVESKRAIEYFKNHK